MVLTNQLTSYYQSDFNRFQLLKHIKKYLITLVIKKYTSIRRKLNPNQNQFGSKIQCLFTFGFKSYFQHYSMSISHLYPGASPTIHNISRLIILFALAEIAVEVLNIYPLKFLLKCIPIFGLIYTVVQFKNTQKINEAKFLIGALVFGVIGDFFLLFKSHTFFISGMLSFLISHLFYIYIFLNNQRAPLPKSPQQKRNIAIGVVVLWMFAILNSILLWDKLPNKLLISLYGVVLTSMITLAILRYKKTPSQSYWTVLVGAILFGLSDNLLGFLKFNNISSSIGAAGVMVTYYASQYLLTFGLLTAMIKTKKN